jgi:hypothetical protein
MTYAQRLLAVYEPTPAELKKAAKILAQPNPTKWTPAKAQARRWAGMIWDSANHSSDAWLYYDVLAAPLRMLEEERTAAFSVRLDSVNSFDHAA